LPDKQAARPRSSRNRHKGCKTDPTPCSTKHSATTACSTSTCHRLAEVHPAAPSMTIVQPARIMLYAHQNANSEYARRWPSPPVSSGNVLRIDFIDLFLFSDSGVLWIRTRKIRRCPGTSRPETPPEIRKRNPPALSQGSALGCSSCTQGRSPPNPNPR
jgi:hypothetical protein